MPLPPAPTSSGTSKYERLLNAIREVVTDSQDVIGDDNAEIEELRLAHNALPGVEPIPTADERFQED